MRYLAASALALCLAASPAAAQHSSGGSTPMGDLMNLNQFATRGFMNQWAATRPAARSGLSRASRTFIKAEVQRQAESPRPVSEVAASIDEVLGKDIHRVARSERADPKDVSGAILLKVLVDTHNALAREARRVPDASGPRPWDERIAEADLNVREAIAMQSELSVAMVRD